MLPAESSMFSCGWVVNGTPELAPAAARVTFSAVGSPKLIATGAALSTWVALIGSEPFAAVKRKV